MEGRATGSIGEKRAADYIARAFERAGLEPAGDEGAGDEGGGDRGWFQAFEFPAAVSLGASNWLRLGDADLGAVDRDWRPLSFSRSGTSGPAPVVFAGYGLLVEGPDGYDSYAGLDVAGKWVVLLRFSPERVSADRRRVFRRLSGLRYKATLARDRGALGMLVVAGPHSKVREPLVAMTGDASNTAMTLYAASIRPELAERLLGRDLGELQAELDAGDAVRGFEVPHAMLEGEIELLTERRTGRNVLARLPGTGGPDLAPVVVGAHYDHLGRGTASSLGERGEIHPGADDNASGVAVALAIAGVLAQDPPSRDVIFAAWSGEESGLLGSNYFVKDLPAFDFHAPPGKRDIAAYLNLDMVGRLRDRLVVYGVGSSPSWPRELELENARLDLPLELQESSYVPSDATSFYLKGVPSLTAFTGAHPEYHTPEDTADLLDYEGMRRIASLVRGLVSSLASNAEVPEYRATERPESAGAGRAFLRAWLGTIPDYAPGDAAPGLPLSGVMKGGPADEAGLRGGDVIVELAGRRIENIYDYTYAIESLRVGETVNIAVLRGGERRSFELTPQSRQ